MGMIQSATAAVTGTDAASAAMKKSMGLNKDDFLQLFITQLKNQDPLNPTDSDKLLSQLSDLTMVEQSYNNNTSLQSMLTAQNNASSLSAVSLIGKSITANGNSISFDGATATTMKFNLGAAADIGTVSISDSSGKLVATSSTGAMTAGDHTLSWDGTDNSGKVLPAGTYSFSVNATKTDGSIVSSTTYTSGTATGVSYSGASPTLAIGSAIVNLSDVIGVKGV